MTVYREGDRWTDYDGEGLRCPHCASIRMVVKSTRDHAANRRRQRECKNCKGRWYTKEITCDVDGNAV